METIAAISARFASTTLIRLALLLALTVPGVLSAPAGAMAASAAPGEILAFGLNRYGELGNTTNNGTNNPNATPTPVTLPGATGPVVQVADGIGDSLAVTSTGQLFGFGNNYEGQLGSTSNNGSAIPSPPAPISLPGATGAVVQAATDGGHSLVVTSTGQLLAFGDNYKGELGFTANNTPNPDPSLVALPDPVVQVAAAAEDSFAVTSTGHLYAWGLNNYGQLGISSNSGTTNPNPTPTLVPVPGNVVQVAAGDNHTLALTSTGQVYAFGENYDGQLGNSTGNYSSVPYPTPTPVTLAGATGQATQIAAGFEDSLVLTSAGELYTFGYNGSGELGIGAENNVPNPTPAPVTLPGQHGAILQIDAAGTSSLAMTTAGQLYGFGSDIHGELADLSLNDVTTPTLISLPGGATVETLARGAEADHSLVVVSDLAVSSPLPSATLGVQYSTHLQGLGGLPPYNWQVSGLLPAGLSLDPATGLISGTPTSTGNYTLSVTVTDASGITASGPVSLAVTPPAVPPPAVSALTVSPRTASTAGRLVHGRCVGRIRRNRHHRRCTRPLSLSVAFSVTGATTVTFTLQRSTPGRLVKGHCVAKTRRNRRHPRCSQVTSLPGTLTRPAATGQNSFALTGSFVGHALTPGYYRLTATAAATSATTTFAITG